jgi:hypothetical protein
MRTLKESQDVVFETITEINRRIFKCNNRELKNKIIRDVCERNGISEKHIREVMQIEL